MIIMAIIIIIKMMWAIFLSMQFRYLLRLLLAGVWYLLPKLIKQIQPRKGGWLHLFIKDAGSPEREVQEWGNLSHPSNEHPVVLLTGKDACFLEGKLWPT